MYIVTSWLYYMHYLQAGLIVQTVKRVVNPELCTQAWCKFHEILSQFPALVSCDEPGDFRSLHLCEAPGAFVTSLKHFIQSRDTGKSLWQLFTWRHLQLQQSIDVVVGDLRNIALYFIAWTVHLLFGGRAFVNNDVSEECMVVQSCKTYTVPYE